MAASAFLNAIEGDPIYEQWYRRIWNFIAARFIDRNKGGGEQIDALRPNAGPFFGKVDIYHALQACLTPTVPTTGRVTRGLLENELDIQNVDSLCGFAHRPPHVLLVNQRGRAMLFDFIIVRAQDKCCAPSSAGFQPKFYPSDNPQLVSF